MTSNSIVKLFSLFILTLTLVQDCDVLSDFDYEVQPNLPYSFNHLDLDLTLSPDDQTVKGVATYTLNAKVPNQTELILYASEVEIDGVTFDGAEVEHRVSGDSLIITTAEAITTTSEQTLAVTFQSRPTYGTHLDRHQTFWSNMNPKALRSWLPVYDHPRVELTVDAAFTIPADQDVIFNGQMTNEDVVSTDQKEVRWQVDTAIPVTGLGFAVGSFSTTEAQSGVHKVRVYKQAQVDADVDALLAQAISEKKAVESALTFEYPWEALNIVVLEDTYWDEVTEGAGLVFVSALRGNMEAQLQRGIAGQWFGQYHRMELFQDRIEGMELVKVALNRAMNQDAVGLINPDSVTSLLAYELYNYDYESIDEYYREVIEQSLSTLISTEKGVVTFDTYASYWYDKTGLNWQGLGLGDQAPDQLDSLTAEADELADYGISLEMDEVNGKAIVYFEHIDSNAETLHAVNMNIYTFDDTTSKEITFTGELDTVVVDVPLSLEYITFDTQGTDLDKVEFGRFPVMMLLSQLRSNEVADRRLAASLLSYHTENPDLQLAIQDALDREENEEVIAALLETLGEFTAGATGTEQQFVNELNNESEAIQLASIKALANYAGDESVPYALQSKIVRAQNETVFEAAKMSLLAVADLDLKLSTVSQLIRMDTTGARSIAMLEVVLAQDTTGQAIELTEQLMGNEFISTVRLQALDLLLEFQTDASYWAEMLVELSNDRDPRIRYRALDATRYLSEGDKAPVLEALRMRESDPRVRAGINSSLEF